MYVDMSYQSVMPYDVCGWQKCGSNDWWMQGYFDPAKPSQVSNLESLGLTFQFSSKGAKQSYE